MSTDSKCPPLAAIMDIISTKFKPVQDLMVIDTLSKFGVNRIKIADFRAITRNLTTEQTYAMLGV